MVVVAGVVRVAVIAIVESFEFFLGEVLCLGYLCFYYEKVFQFSYQGLHPQTPSPKPLNFLIRREGTDPSTEPFYRHEGQNPSAEPFLDRMRIRFMICFFDMINDFCRINIVKQNDLLGFSVGFLGYLFR